MRSTILLLVVALGTACGSDDRTGAMEDGPAPGDEAVAERAPGASSVAADREAGRPLCHRIEDDEALTPDGAERLELPGLAEANSERRCIFAFGVDMPIADVRRFYRSTLPERGYEIVRDQETEGIAAGNLSRTFFRGTKPERRVVVQIDEFDLEEWRLSDHPVNVKLQFDAAGD